MTKEYDSNSVSSYEGIPLEGVYGCLCVREDGTLAVKEGYNDWSVAVSLRALSIGLKRDLEIDFGGAPMRAMEAMTVEEVAATRATAMDKKIQKRRGWEVGEKLRATAERLRETRIVTAPYQWLIGSRGDGRGEGEIRRIADTVVPAQPPSPPVSNDSVPCSVCGKPVTGMDAAARGEPRDGRTMCAGCRDVKTGLGGSPYVRRVYAESRPWFAELCRIASGFGFIGIRFRDVYICASHEKFEGVMADVPVSDEEMIRGESEPGLLASLVYSRLARELERWEDEWEKKSRQVSRSFVIEGTAPKRRLRFLSQAPWAFMEDETEGIRDGGLTLREQATKERYASLLFRSPWHCPVCGRDDGCMHGRRDHEEV